MGVACNHKLITTYHSRATTRWWMIADMVVQDAARSSATLWWPYCSLGHYLPFHLCGEEEDEAVIFYEKRN